MTAEPRRTGADSRADLHIHTLASDGVSSVAEILERAEALGLAVIAITDHERIDAAHAAQAMAEARGLRVQVIVGEEISTRGGHVVGPVHRGADPAVGIAALDDRPDPRAGRHRHRRPPARARIR